MIDTPRTTRHFIWALAWTTATLAASQAWGQTISAVNSSRPVRVLVGFAAGGALDLTARIIANKWADNNNGQPMIVENRPGASSNTAAEVVVKGAADGQTLYMGSYVNAVSPSMFLKLSYDPVKDLTPIVRVVTTASVLLVNASSPVRSLQDLVALANSKQGQLSYSSAGNGSASHLAGELLASRANVKMLHVPYKGSPQAIMDVVGGQVDLTFAVMSGALPQIQSGKLRALAVTSLERSRLLPDVPTVAESGYPGFQQLQWYGLFGPAGIPSSTVERFNREVIQIIKIPDVAKQLAAQGLDIAPSSPNELAELLKSEIAMYAKIVRDAGIKPE